MQKAELAEKYGLTERQAEELREQYWMEYVLGNLYSLEHDYIFVQGLGVFSAKLNKLKRELKNLERRLAKITPETVYYASLEEKRDKISKLIEYVELNNSQKTYKRYYG